MLLLLLRVCVGQSQNVRRRATRLQLDDDDPWGLGSIAAQPVLDVWLWIEVGLVVMKRLE